MRISLAFLLYVGSSSLLAHFLAALYGQLTSVIAGFSLLAGLVLAVVVGQSQASQESFRFSKTELFFLLTVFVFVARDFVYLLYPVGDQLLTWHNNNLGDLPLHITHIKHLSSGALYPPKNPYFAGGELLYPLGMDLHSALYQALGFRLSSHLFLIAMASTMVTMWMFFRFSRALGVIAFFFNGGALGIYLLFNHLKETPAAYGWKPFLTSIWLTQRSMLWALPVGVFLLGEMKKFFEEKKELSWPSLLLFAILPFFHLHSFLFFCLFFFLVFLFHYRHWRSFLPLLWALPTAAYFIWRSTEGFQRAGVIHWQWGWVAGSSSALVFWLWNLGPWLALFFFLIFLVVKEGRESDQKWLGIHSSLFLFFTCVIFAPWDWDNIKLLLWPYLGLVVLAADFLKRDHFSQKARGVLLFLLFLTGLSALVHDRRENVVGVQLYSTSELERVRETVRDLSTDTVFAAWPTYNHPLSALGYKLAMGYEGHLWSHGIDFEDRRNQLRQLMTGAKNWRKIAREMGVQFIFWGEREREHYGDLQQGWRSELKNISSVNGIEIYALD